MIVCELIKGSRSEIRKADPSRRPRKRFPFVCWSGEGCTSAHTFIPSYSSITACRRGGRPITVTSTASTNGNTDETCRTSV